ncbi:MAG: hypothetical protein IPH87_20840 [Anaerolineae bacterium]|nr:hypothetical protein [Anaerolineae bacterium]
MFPPGLGGRGAATREDIRLALERQDIESRPLWKPMHLQPVFQGCEVTLPRPLPAREGRSVAEALFRDGLCLPSGTAMSEADLARWWRWCGRSIQPTPDLTP